MSAEYREMDLAVKESADLFRSASRSCGRDDSQDSLVIATSSSLLEQLESYACFEKLCDDAISRQESLSRTVAQNMRSIQAPRDVSLGSHDTETDALTPRHPFEQIRSRGAILHKVVSTVLPLTHKRLLLSEVVELPPFEQLENEIRVLQFHLRRLETDILARTPRTALEATQKLRFLTALMLTGEDLEVDLFAYLVEECADALEAPGQTESL